MRRRREISRGCIFFFLFWGQIMDLLWGGDGDGDNEEE